MFLLNWFKKIRRRKSVSANPRASDLDSRLERDAGIKVTRIRLPSGKEVVLVEKECED